MLTTAICAPPMGGIGSRLLLPVMQPEFLPMPAVDEWFLLVVEYIDPMSTVSSADFRVFEESREKICPEKWSYIGPRIFGKINHWVKLTRLGSVASLRDARLFAEQEDCCLLPGQARDFFKAKFQRHNDLGPVVFGGSKWEYMGTKHTTFLGRNYGGSWLANMTPAVNIFSMHCLWAVTRKDKHKPSG